MDTTGHDRRYTRFPLVFPDGNEQYYHGHHLGSASVITNSTGDIKQKVEYYPFGTYRYGTPSTTGTYDYDPTFPNVNYTFTDQEDDDETGFYNFKARLYDPLIGRFISADSIVQGPGDPQTLNRYSYCRNNPLIYTDPSGHIFGIDDLIIIGIGMAIGALMAGATSDWDPKAMAVGAVIGGVSAGVGSWAGGLAATELTSVIEGAVGYCSAGTAAAGQFGGAIVGGAVGGATAGGLSAGIYGGNIGNAMLKGAAYGAASTAVMYGVGQGIGYMRNNWNQWFPNTENAQENYGRLAAGTNVDQSSKTTVEALQERWSDYDMNLESVRRYTVLDWPGPETPFEIAHFKHEFLNQVKVLRQTDPTYQNQWAHLYKNYSTLRAIIDFYRFDVNEAIEHYRNGFRQY